jgi:hypothetical protein
MGQTQSQADGSIEAETPGNEESGGRFFGYGALKATGRLILSWLIGSVLVALLVFAFGLTLDAFTTGAQIGMLVAAVFPTYFVLRNRTRF